MGNKNILFFPLWIILGKLCATFSFDLETATGAEFGEFADKGTHAQANAIHVDMQKQVSKNLSACIYIITVWARRFAAH